MDAQMILDAVSAAELLTILPGVEFVAVVRRKMMADIRTGDQKRAMLRRLGEHLPSRLSAPDVAKGELN